MEQDRPIAYVKNISIFSLRILGEPSLAYPLPLLKQLLDGPEAGAADHPKHRGENGIIQKQRRHREQYAQHGEYRPFAASEIIFEFDDDGVKQSDAQKRNDGDNESG